MSNRGLLLETDSKCYLHSPPNLTAAIRDHGTLPWRWSFSSGYFYQWQSMVEETKGKPTQFMASASWKILLGGTHDGKGSRIETCPERPLVLASHTPAYIPIDWLIIRLMYFLEVTVFGMETHIPRRKGLWLWWSTFYRSYETVPPWWHLPTFIKPMPKKGDRFNPSTYRSKVLFPCLSEMTTSSLNWMIQQNL